MSDPHAASHRVSNCEAIAECDDEQTENGSFSRLSNYTPGVILSTTSSTTSNITSILILAFGTEPS